MNKYFVNIAILLQLLKIYKYLQTDRYFISMYRSTLFLQGTCPTTYPVLKNTYFTTEGYVLKASKH